jgi:hypothetical protein
LEESINDGSAHGVQPSRHSNSSSNIAYIHSHGAESGPGYDDKNFSGNNGDKGYAYYYGINGYVVTPSGVVKRFNVRDGSTVYHTGHSALRWATTLIWQL